LHAGLSTAVLQIVPHMRVLVARAPLDLRKGIDGTAAVCRQTLAEDPLSGAVFVFRNRAGTMVRVLVYDGQGMWLMTKRLSAGRFRFWCEPAGHPSQSIAAHELVTLLAGGDWTHLDAAACWRPIGPASQARISA
jgi:transposase